MQHKISLQLLKVLCLGTAVHGLGLLTIASVHAETTPAKPATTATIDTIRSLTPVPVVAPVTAPVAAPITAQVATTPSAPTPPVVTPPVPAAPITTLEATPPTLTTPVTPPVVTPTPTNPVGTGVRILAPAPNAVLDIPATSVVLQYPVGTTIELKVNDTLVDSKLIGRTETDAKTNLITQTWYGVSLSGGKNILTAKTSQGVVTTATIQVAGAPTKIQLTTSETRIPADGRSLVNIEGQLLDENNNPSNQDSVVTLFATAGEFAGVDTDKDQPGFQVLVIRGKFSAKLRAGLDAQTVRIRATNLNMEAYAQVQFETNLRSSIATGVFDVRLGARGTDYYRPFSEFVPVDRNNSSQLQARGQVFATGRIGDWSATDRKSVV